MSLGVVAQNFGAIEPIMRATLTGVHFAALLIASVYGLHRFWLVWRCWRTRRRGAAAAPSGEHPRVTVQLPLFNESTVAERVIEAACAIDWPRDRLQIQVLDDSTDDCAGISRACVARLRDAGHDIEWLHRSDRTGFKAGALQHGLGSSTGEFIALFDADFVPPRDFLRRTIPAFDADDIGMVQAAWDHLNRDESVLTRCQAVWLDSHFQIEHPARERDGCWFNFNGTAGVWRRAAIEGAGGWQHDTLTEDMDLSYRAQIAGWRFRYLPHLLCPAELPATIGAFKTQQHRWTKGTVQTARKLLGAIMRSNASWAQKREAFMHLTSPVVHFVVIAIGLLMYPVIALNVHVFDRDGAAHLGFGLLILLLATASGCTFYAAGQRARRVPWRRTLLDLPCVVILGIGMSVNGAAAALAALVGHESPFVRTPKAGNGQPPRPARRQRWLTVLELLLGTYMLVCAVLAAVGGAPVATPFLLLFATGYLVIGLMGALSGHGGPTAPRRACGPRSGAAQTQQTEEPSPAFVVGADG